MWFWRFIGPEIVLVGLRSAGAILLAAEQAELFELLPHILGGTVLDVVHPHHPRVLRGNIDMLQHRPDAGMLLGGGVHQERVGLLQHAHLHLVHR